MDVYPSLFCKLYRIVQKMPEELPYLPDIPLKHGRSFGSQINYELLDIYLRTRSFEKALASLDEVERLRGTSEDAVRTRYNIYSEMGRHDDAIAALEKFNAEYSSPMILAMAGDYYLADIITKTADD